MYNMPESELLRLLADRAGIAADYHDIAGTCHVTADDTRRAILSAMGFRVSSHTDLIEELTAWDDRPWLRGCEPVRILRVGQEPGTWSLHVPRETDDEERIRIRWRLQGENGERHIEQVEGPGLKIDEVRVVRGRRYVRVQIALPLQLPMGYYDVHAAVEGLPDEPEARFRLIVAPDRCHVPDCFGAGTRLWGLALQLYSLRSESNWGIGDFRDLAAVVEWAGKRLGASLIGLNPLHALKNTTPYHISPYSPNSRLFLNEIYIDVESVPEFQTSPDARNRFADPSFRARLEAARRSEFVEYDAVAQAKRTLLEICYENFLRDHFEELDQESAPRTARGQAFASYVREEGESLLHYAVFQTLEEEQRLKSGAMIWADWPESYKTPTSDAVQEFQRQHTRRVWFFVYLQWLAAEQLSALVKKTGEAGMPIGFYLDMALGSDRYGADGWRFQDVLALQADCGAPPDAFAPEGQNWGFSPTDPLRLRETGYQYFIDLLRKNLRYGGAIRLDHVMVLFRLFWIPRGLPASKGTYVYYPADDLLAILALESVRAGTLVIGEDLGTVPDWVRERLGHAGVLSYRVFYFERTETGDCKPPHWYPAQSLAVVTTHDLPTLSGYWEACDIDLRAGLGLVPTEDIRQASLAERQLDKRRWLAALKSEGLLPPETSDDPDAIPEMTGELAQAIHQFLARTPSWLVLANIEDVTATRDQVNLPGTLNQHPNWRRKLALTVEALVHDPRFQQLVARMRSERSRGEA